ncbi:MAG: outer membrane beta-barrel protein [Flavobacteriales bacterium]
MNLKTRILLFILSLPGYLIAQQYVLKGFIADSSEHAVPAEVSLYIMDSMTYKVNTDSTGFFEVKVKSGMYLLNIQSPAFKDYQRSVNVQSDTNLQKIYLRPNGVKEIKIIRAPGVAQKGDTTQYSAKAYKTNPDASAEDLVKKMPGITIENGTVKAQGEEVKNVTVDGKVFFGDDANIALKNLSADMIDKVEVFDQWSDQAQFTGFDDGNSQKAINIVTKSQTKNGTFGKLYGGYGADNRYQAGGTLNLFNKHRRFSLLGMSNNINQQNFSMQDILAATGGSAPMPGRGGGNSPANNFLQPSQSGITSVNSFGINYSDQWSKKMKVTASYFFTNSSNVNQQNLSRQFFSPNDSSLYYDEIGDYNNASFNHRINAKLEYAMDTMNSFIFTPNISFQNGFVNNGIQGQNSLMQSILYTRSQNTYESESNGYRISNELLYRHKFQKKGRTLSLSVKNDLNSKSADNTLKALNTYYLTSVIDTLDQLSKQYAPGESYIANATYTEPLGRISQLMLNYKAAYSSSTSLVETNHYDFNTQEYSVFDTTLSSRLQSNYLTYQPGLAYRVNIKKVNASVGMDYQRVHMFNTQALPYSSEVSRTFESLLPNAMLRVKFSSKSNIRLFYRTQINLPSVNQLQEVWNNSNPLLLYTGNSALKAQYANNVNLRYTYTDPSTSRSFMVFANINSTHNYVTNATEVMLNDTIMDDGKALQKGTRITMPVNMGGYWSARSHWVFSTPVKKLKSNFSSASGFNYSSIPALVNKQKSFSDSYTMMEGLNLSSNISEKIDFTISTTANYNIVRNTLQNTNYNYFYLLSSFKMSYTFWKGMVLQTDVNHTYYTGLGQNFNLNYFLWNAALAKKLFKGDAGEIKVSVFDILKQNNSVSRTVSDTYVDDLRNVVLQQYFMLTFTYKIKKIAATDEIPAKQ